MTDPDAFELVHPDNWGATAPPQGKNEKLHRARRVVNDEFYTRPQDIRAEIGRYPSGTFRGKIIYCPCDPKWSAFPKVLRQEKNRLGIERVMASGADFKTYESMARLDGCDIVITNPLFSLLGEFVHWVIDARKDFLVVAPMSALDFPWMIELVKSDEMRIHLRNRSLDKFYIPEGTEHDRIDETGRPVKIVQCLWLTSLWGGHDWHARIEPSKEYDPVCFEAYDSIDAIEIPNLRSIPKKCPRTMGVPVTYLPVHDPSRYDLVGITSPFLNGRQLFRRILIKERRR